MSVTRGEAAVAVAEHRDLVRVLLSEVLRTGHSWRIERDDIEQAGLIGLWRAALGYDTEKSEASFLTYASHRVRGAMKDEIRHALGGRVNGFSPAHRKRGLAATQSIGERSEFAKFMKSMAPDPSDVVLPHDVEDLIDRLEKRDRTIILAFDIDGFSMLEIGNALGVSESRISQLRSRALKQLAKAAA